MDKGMPRGSPGKPLFCCREQDGGRVAARLEKFLSPYINMRSTITVRFTSGPQWGMTQSLRKLEHSTARSFAIIHIDRLPARFREHLLFQIPFHIRAIRDITKCI